MRAAVVGPGGALTVAEVPDPDLAPDQALVRVHACGICGSDLHMRRAGMFPVGCIPGHEMGGTIEACGPDVEGWAPGDAVAVYPARVCGTCPPCRRGEPELCPAQTPTAMGLGPRPGGLAECVTVWPDQLHLLPTGVTPAEGALAEPVAVGLHGVARSGIGPGDAAVVLGGGSIGVMTALALRAQGVTGFFVSEPSEERRGVLARLGVETCPPAEAFTRSGASGLGPAGPDVVFDCTGVGPVLQEAVGMVRTGGTVMLMGVVGQPATVLPAIWLLKEVAVKGVLGYGRQFPEAVAALGDGRVDTTTLAATRVPLAEAAAAFDRLATAAAPPKILVEPGR